MTTEYEKAMDAQPVAWVAADTLNSPHPGCVSSLAYVSQLDKDRGREYVPLYADPVAAQGEDDAWCAECGAKLENVRPGKHQHPTYSQAEPHQPEARVGGEVSYAECCDTPAYCSSVRRCTAQDTPPPSAVPEGMVAALAEFARWALKSSSFVGCDLDGGTVQDKAEALGLIHPVEVDAPCGDECQCAEFGFPTTCYRLSPVLAAAPEPGEGSDGRG